jgi:hypothetical protein
MSGRLTSRGLIAAAAALLCVMGTAEAQTPVNAPSAMQPSVGRVNVHQMAYVRWLGGSESTDGRDVRQFVSLTEINYGVLGNLALSLDIPLVHNRFSGEGFGASTGESSKGLGDLALTAKWRVWQHDTGPTDTRRVSLIGGLQIPGGTEMYMDSSGDAWNPMLGAVFSIVEGRHGGNASAIYELDTGTGADTLRYDLSYLFRLAPSQFDMTTSHGAWYAIAELNGLYETNGNNELFFAPGLMYEATWWTVDATLILPVVRDVSDRPKSEIAFGVGLRVNF